MRRLLTAVAAGLALWATGAQAQSAAAVPVTGEERLSGAGVDAPTAAPTTLPSVQDAQIQQRATSRRLRAEREALVAERHDFDAAKAESEAAKRDLDQDRRVNDCLERTRDAEDQARCAFSPPAR